MKQVVKVCEDFSNHWSHLYSPDIDRFIADYEEMMIFVLRKWFGLKKKQAKQVIGTLGQGNWEKLRPTAEEKELPLYRLTQDIAYDIFYCSDRWTWDRVLRINWMALQLKERRMMEEQVCII